MALNYDRLLKLRLIVARFGEMDHARWWNTKGQLGALGALALRRGFPRTHAFAQARSVFAVASQRCRELFDPPGCVTLWQLPENVEEEFDARWENWLDQAQDWQPFFEGLHRLDPLDLPDQLRRHALVKSADQDRYSRLSRSDERRSVLINGTFSNTDGDVSLLALAFAVGSVSAPVVPYMRRDGV